MDNKPAYYYKTVSQEGSAEFKDRGSRFLAHVFPVDNEDVFKQHLSQLKEAHPKAVHHCYAWRMGLTMDYFRANDDGEPSGSAGRPILGQIDSKELTNVAIVVVRYFGGTLLGVPGLINAYKTASSLALQVTPVIDKVLTKNYHIHCTYPLLNDVMTILRQEDASIVQMEQTLFCDIIAAVPLNHETRTLHRLSQIHPITVTEWNPK